MDDPVKNSASSEGPVGSPDAGQAAPPQPGPAGETLETLPLDEAIRQAADEIRRAAALVVRSLQGEATERLASLRESPAAGPVGRILDFVKEYPVQGSIIALLVGFLLGRSLKK